MPDPVSEREKVVGRRLARPISGFRRSHMTTSQTRHAIQMDQDTPDATWVAVTKAAAASLGKPVSNTVHAKALAELVTTQTTSATRSKRRRNRAWVLPVGLEDPHPTLESGHLVAIFARQALSATVVNVGLANPVPERFHRAAEVPRDSLDRAAGADETDGLGPELGRVRRMRSSSERGLLPGAAAPSLEVSTEPGELQVRRDRGAAPRCERAVLRSICGQDGWAS